MKTKVVNWTSKVNKYNSLEKMMKLQPSYKGNPYTDPSYWDYYLNYISEARVNGTETNVNTVAEFKSISSYARSFQDTCPDAGALINKENLLNPSITKVMSCPTLGDGSSTSGFRMQIKSTYQPTKPRQFNSIVIQLNKLDKAYMDTMRKAAFRFEFMIKEDDGNSLTPTNGVVHRIVFSPNMGTFYPEINDNVTVDLFNSETYIVDGNSQTANLRTVLITNHYNFEEGLFVIDAELMKYLGYPNGLPYVNTTDSGKTLHYSFAFYKLGAGETQMEVANVTFTNGFELELDESIKFGRDNLTTFNISKKTGVYFPDQNEHNKILEASINLLTAQEAAALDVFVVKNNLNTPFYVLPYAEPSEYLTLSETKNSPETAIYRALNMGAGSLYILDPSFDFSSPVWDNYSVKLKLAEYK